MEIETQLPFVIGFFVELRNPLFLRWEAIKKRWVSISFFLPKSLSAAVHRLIPRLGLGRA